MVWMGCGPKIGDCNRLLKTLVKNARQGGLKREDRGYGGSPGTIHLFNDPMVRAVRKSGLGPKIGYHMRICFSAFLTACNYGS